jgi:hypothetical protein
LEIYASIDASCRGGRRARAGFLRPEQIAWVLVDWDWPRVIKFGALIGAITIALLLFMGVLLLDRRL